MTLDEASETIIRVAQLMRSASRDNAGVFASAAGLSNALAEIRRFDLQVFAVEDSHTQVDLPAWREIKVNSYRMLPPRAFSFAPELIKGVMSFHPQILHQHGLWSYPSLVTQRIVRRGEPRVVVSIHGMLSDWALRHRGFRKQAALWLYERANLIHADCLHALTEQEVEAIRRLNINTPVCVISNGVDLADCSGPGVRSKTGGDRFELLYVGRLHPVKGVEELLRGWSLFISRAGHGGHDHWRLRIIGEGEEAYASSLVELAKRMGVADSVKFAGPKYGKDLNAAYAQADAFILVSHSEAMPMSVLEAWAAGLPVIMTRACGFTEGFQKGAALKCSSNPDNIAKAISEMVNMDESRRRQMGRLGSHLIELRYNWRCAAQSTAAVYQWLLGLGPKPECVIS